MRVWLTRAVKRLRAHLRGAQFEKALERNRKAADELDKVVREVLKT